MGKKNLAVARLSRNKLTAAISLALAIGPVPLLAAPTGGVVTSGTASISQSGSVTNVSQSTQKAAINWQGFSIAPNETVNFLQPNSSAITLNRVVGNERSVIEGALNANGRVFLINSNGVLFTQGSSVNTAGLVASTLNMSDADFEAGNYVFQGNGSSASVINLGTLTADEGGYIALLGNTVSNQGVIAATKGTVALAAGEKITLNFNGDSLLSVTLDEGALNALVENKQAIYADGGKVFLTAKAANEVLGSQVNNTGIVQARTLSDLTQGEIVISAYGGTANIDGTLDASAPTGGDGGSIETSGKKVRLADSAVITTKANSGTNGEWLIGSDGYTIAATGGDITGARLSSLLATGLTNIRINSISGASSDGSLNVNDAVSWNADSKLTLEASGDVSINSAIAATGDYSGLVLAAADDINVNADVTLSGSHASLAMNYGGDYHILTSASYSGTTTDADGNVVAKSAPAGTEYASITLSGSDASLRINGENYTLIHSLDDIATTGTASGRYALAQDIDAAQWSVANNGTASVVNTLTGTLAGLGNSISNLELNAPTSSAGFIGTASGAVIRDVGLNNVRVVGDVNVGALIGLISGASVRIANVYAVGYVNAVGGTGGGLIGYVSNSNNALSYLSSSYADVDVEGSSSLGGLIGSVRRAINVDQVHSLGSVTGTAAGTGFGGLIGVISNTTSTTAASSISNAYAKGTVIGGGEIGGLVGYINAAARTPVSIVNSFAAGDVKVVGSDGQYAGGLVGRAEQNVTIANSHATGIVDGNVSGFDFAGGLVGILGSGSSISNSYATGDVYIGSGQFAGGLAGSVVSGAIVTHAYATGDVIGLTAQSVGGLVGSNSGSISDSWASGNVAGHGAVGGLAGSNSGAITRSDAYGNVAAYGIDGTSVGGEYAPGGGAGGLVGSNQGGSITESTASGSVTGERNVGGLVGTMYGGSITRSVATGRVSGGSAVGGLVGYVRGEPTIDNSYWNMDSTGQGEAIGAYFDESSFAHLNNTQGLSSDQYADVNFYLDGTILQVLEARAQAAAEAAAQRAAEVLQARASDAAQVADQVIQEMMRRVDPPSQKLIVSESSSDSLDSNISFVGFEDFSANIRRIEVDGMDFEIESAPDESESPAQ